MREIPLTQGKTAYVDDSDYEWLKAFKWSACRYGLSWYARTHVPGSGKNGRTLLMHRLLLPTSSGLQVDHIDHDGLNNCRDNLRAVTPAQQRQNRRGADSRNRCGVRGVSYREKTGRYIVQVTLEEKTYYIGSFGSLAEADHAAREARARMMTHAHETI